MLEPAREENVGPRYSTSSVPVSFPVPLARIRMRTSPAPTGRDRSDAAGRSRSSPLSNATVQTGGLFLARRFRSAYHVAHSGRRIESRSSYGRQGSRAGLPGGDDPRRESSPAGSRFSRRKCTRRRTERNETSGSTRQRCGGAATGVDSAFSGPALAETAHLRPKRALLVDNPVFLWARCEHRRAGRICIGNGAGDTEAQA